MITQKSTKLSRQCVRNPSKDLMSFKVINWHFFKKIESLIKYGLFSCSSRIIVGLPLSKFVYLREAVSAAFKGSGVQMVF